MITYAIGILAAMQAPSRDSLLAQGIRRGEMEPARALEYFQAVLAQDSSDVAANWRAALALSSVAALSGHDSLLADAERHARRAVRLAPADVGALFALGLVLGNTALSRSIKQRIRLAVEIRELAVRALAADSSHDGAHHLLGRWNHEVMQFSGFQRFIARNFLGGGVIGLASWEAARHHLERAAELDSTSIFHRLDLARLYLARKDPARARAELERIEELPDRVAADRTYRAEARQLRERIGERQ